MARCRRRSASCVPALAALALLLPPTVAYAVQLPPPTVTPGAAEVSIHYQIHGTLAVDRPLVVLVHGWSCDSSYWREQLPALLSDHDVVTLDLAGHGASADGRDEFSMRSFGEDVQRVVAALPTRAPVILVGHSMGGPVAAEAARLLGARVRAVIGVDTFSTIGRPAPPPAETAARLALFERDFVGTTRLFVDNTFFRPDADPKLRRWIVEDMAQGNPRVGIAAVRELNAWDGVAVLRELSVPVIAINSDRSRIDEARIRTLLPNFRLRVLEGTAHFLMLEEPARFNEALLEELMRLR
jgi:pimeloyl-ACP methyl ester carboxylesterase